MSGTCGATSLEGFTERSQQWLVCCVDRDDCFSMAAQPNIYAVDILV